MKTIIALILLLVLGVGLFGHAASNVTMSYDAKTKLLTVDFDHSVKNAADHYINNVTVKVSGKEVISQDLTVQESAAGGSLVYKLLGVKAGTVIDVVTTCNKVGKKAAKLTVK